MKTATHATRRIALVLALGVFTFACGSGGDDDSADAGQSCPQAGVTETGCACEGERQGHRTCTAELVWEPCSCPSADAGCVPGDPVACRCSATSPFQMTVCPDDGRLVCPCDAGAAPDASAP